MTNLYIFKTKKKNTASLVFQKKKIECIVGANGIGNKRREGDSITPRGTYRFLEVFYRPDKIKCLKASIPVRKIKKSSYWCVDSKSQSYNSFQARSQNFICEKLFRKDSLYDVFINISYNIKPCKKFKGSAIFIHCCEKKTYSTEGCLALEKKYIFEILKLIKPTSKLVIY